MTKEYVPYEGPIVTRKEAKDQGLKRYFLGAGEPCKHGHISERYTVNRRCAECGRITWDKYQEMHGEKRAAQAREFYPEIAEKERARSLAYKADNKEETKKYHKEWCARNRDKRRATCLKWASANRGILSDKQKQYRKRKKDFIYATQKKWNADNPDKLKAYRRNRKARVLDAEGSHTAEDILRIGAAQKWKCAWCGTKCKNDHHVDHIQPLALGGSNWPSNLCVACPTCNLSKSKKDPIEFAQSLGLLI